MAQHLGLPEGVVLLIATLPVRTVAAANRVDLRQQQERNGGKVLHAALMLVGLLLLLYVGW